MHPGIGSEIFSHIISCHIFWLNTPKGTTKAPAVDFVRLNILKGTKAAFLTPIKRYNEHPHHFFFMGVPPPLPLPRSRAEAVILNSGSN